MTLMRTPWIGRRSVAIGGLAATAGLLWPAGSRAQSRLVATPRQSMGPFYPVDWSGEADADLVQVRGEAARARGTVAHVRGRVLDLAGSPVPGALVEIWQADAAGRYHHPRDRPEGRDARFQGRGRVVTDAEGRYGFRTIRPVAYEGRAPHIHFAISAPGRDRLVTQLYVANDPLNARDGLLNAIRDPRQRAAVIARFDPAERIEAGALLASFDIVIG